MHLKLFRKEVIRYNKEDYDEVFNTKYKHDEEGESETLKEVAIFNEDLFDIITNLKHWDHITEISYYCKLPFKEEEPIVQITKNNCEPDDNYNTQIWINKEFLPNWLFSIIFNFCLAVTMGNSTINYTRSNCKRNVPIIHPSFYYLNKIETQEKK